MNPHAFSDLAVYPESIVEHEGVAYFLARERDSGEKCLGVMGQAGDFEGKPHAEGGALICPLTPANAAALRARLPWLNPVPLGLRTAVGMGDRLGLATPGHAAAARGTGVAPIFAQQSVRENARTRRSPQQVLDDAMWGVFQAGWRDPWGADADHLKETGVMAAFVEAGYTFFTVDPGDHVDGDADTDTKATLEDKLQAVPWDVLDSSPEDLMGHFLGLEVPLDGMTLVFDEIKLMRAAVKYGPALAHVARLYRHLCELMGDRPFDFEVSVDETETPTSVHEHYYIATELQRLGVTWVSLAPRFVGRFEKGVDFIGDLDELEQDIARHVAVMQCVGGYKLSVHSGSDKFSVYPLAARHAGELVHVKTAGTSYLEALRVIAEVDPAFFREILGFSRNRYDDDRATYHVSARKENVPLPADVPDADLPGLLDQFDARQVLHVAYGSVLDRFGRRLHTVLEQHEARYSAVLERHFARHLAPFRRA